MLVILLCARSICQRKKSLQSFGPESRATHSLNFHIYGSTYCKLTAFFTKHASHLIEMDILITNKTFEDREHEVCSSTRYGYLKEWKSLFPKKDNQTASKEPISGSTSGPLVEAKTLCPCPGPGAMEHRHCTTLWISVRKKILFGRSIGFETELFRSSSTFS